MNHGSFSSIEDQDQPYEVKQNPILDRLNESNPFLGIEPLGIPMLR
jgi:hypothetical protein